MAELNEAYEILGNPSKRSEYNRGYCKPIKIPDKSKFDIWWGKYCGFIFGIPWAIGLIYFLNLLQVQNFNSDRIFHSFFLIIMKFIGAAIASFFVGMSAAIAIAFYFVLPICAVRDYWRKLTSLTFSGISERFKLHLGLSAIGGGLFFLSLLLANFAIDNKGGKGVFVPLIGIVGLIGVNFFWIFLLAIPPLLIELLALLVVLIWSKKVIKKTQALVAMEDLK